MSLALWQLWIVIGVVMFVVEIFTPGFLFGCLGLSCLLAGGAAWLHLGMIGQLCAFIAGSLISFFGIRPFILRCTNDEPKARTNVDALVNKIGHVTEKIDPRKNSGRMMVGGDDWKAETADDAVIETGARAKVLKVDGTRLVVEEVKS